MGGYHLVLTEKLRQDEAERALGRDPKEMPHSNPGYDVESKGLDGRLLFIEVKGRVAGARTVTLTRNEILTELNKPDTFILALVVVEGEDVVELKYLRRPFEREPAPEECSVNYDLGALLKRGTEPAEAFRRDLETAKALASRVFWEGDIVGGRIGVFWIPDPDNMTFEYAFAWKQVNNGSTFIVSPIPLPWLERVALRSTTT